MNILDKKGINETFAQVPSLKKVHILEDGRHYFNEAHAKAANGYTTEKGEDGQIKQVANKVKYTSLAPDAKELVEETAK
jgi:hypothetical protein